VHHTNEIAQSEAYLGDGRPLVRWWLHGGFINLSGAKISKSAGGGVLVGDLASLLTEQAAEQADQERLWPSVAARQTARLAHSCK
jgi:cysteinyl-tRNA synthetase